ncbi:MAG: tRNA preQ1(34) S-adenosylmethionine ribosyltransferase-isomerase QueA [Alphaproteobacteria bacterium]
MDVNIFDFNLPEEQIALRPASPRDTSKLLYVNQGQFKDFIFKDIVELCHSGDIIVFNDTRVIPARLFGKRGDAKIEATLCRNDGEGKRWALIKNSKRLKIGQTINFYAAFDDNQEQTLDAKVIAKEEAAVLIDFMMSDVELLKKLREFGVMPLPPYIDKKRKVDKKDSSDYQTIYAKNDGAVAAPTAGLHFTENVMQCLKEKGVKALYVTLHVGEGTFLPIKVDDTKDHKMHSEFGVVTQEVADEINNAKKAGSKIISVGTTSLRILESASQSGILKAFKDNTDIFITPGYKFKTVDALITNFHLPKSTLFMLVCALAGTENMKKAYDYAIQNNYRFYSYGDSSFLELNKN